MIKQEDENRNIYNRIYYFINQPQIFSQIINPSLKGKELDRIHRAKINLPMLYPCDLTTNL